MYGSPRNGGSTGRNIETGPRGISFLGSGGKACFDFCPLRLIFSLGLLCVDVCTSRRPWNPQPRTGPEMSRCVGVEVASGRYGPSALWCVLVAICSVVWKCGYDILDFGGGGTERRGALVEYRPDTDIRDQNLQGFIQSMRVNPIFKTCFPRLEGLPSVSQQPNPRIGS